jgi:uncharacterized protein (DUF2267 family)
MVRIFNTTDKKRGICMGEQEGYRSSPPEDKSILFFRNVKRVLGISSTQSIVALVSKVLTHVCRNLPGQQATALMSRLPVTFQPLFFRAGSDSAPCCAYLDELVENMYEEDRRSEHPQFSTEVEALNAVVVILRKLDKYLNIFSYNILKPQWVEGLRQIPLEDAA